VLVRGAVLRDAQGARAVTALATRGGREHELRGDVFSERLRDLGELALFQHLRINHRGRGRVERDGECGRKR
jgi:hypothetical protein